MTPRKAEAVGGLVRKLKWRKAIEGTLSGAVTLIGTYRVWTHAEANGRWFWCLDGVKSGDAQDEGAAKAAAQADYEQRILSALNTDLLSELEAVKAERDGLLAALAKIERWELPRTGRRWNENEPLTPENEMSYGALYGSNGERDFIRGIARTTLTGDTTDAERAG